MNEENKVGRKRTEVSPEAFEDALRRFRAGELSTTEAAEACGLSRSAFYRRVQAEAPKQSLGDVLKDVSDSDTGRERIEYLSPDEVEPDPKNFYSLTGLEELAANIELVGLQQPLRVRENDHGTYTVVSGHRRLAAIMTISEGGSEQFSQGVPCIVERSEDSPEMRELKLIYANAAIRVMSSAEISQQAERVEELLYRLKEQGVEFPGRMRDHVAEACRISRSKLARLQAIRANLRPELLELFDAGKLPEETAYQLGRLPAELQDAVSEQLSSGKRKNPPVGSTVEAVVRNLEKLQDAPYCRAHAGGEVCHNVTGKIVRSVFAPYSWQVCDKSCCMDCYQARQGCRGACKEARDRVQLEKNVEKEKAEKAEKKREAEFEGRKAQIVKISKQLLPAIERAGLKDEDALFPHYQAARVADVRKWAAGETGNGRFYSTECVRPWSADNIRSMAAKLGITAGQVIGTEPMDKVSESDTVPTPAWQQGDRPPKDGRYICLIDLGNGTAHEGVLERLNGKWFAYGAPLVAGRTVTSWWPVPGRVGKS